MESHHTTVRGVPLRWKETGEGFPRRAPVPHAAAPAPWRHVVPFVGEHGVPENHPDTIATALKDLLGAVA